MTADPIPHYYFEELARLEAADFFGEFDKQILKRQTPDPKEREIYDSLKLLECGRSLSCFSALLTNAGFENLILPHHDHGSNLVPSGGCGLAEVVKKIIVGGSRTAGSSDCLAKINDLKNWLANQRLTALDAEFIFLSNSRKYAHDENHYSAHHGPNRLYMGNGLHRLIAYGLCISESGFKPLRIHYAHIIAG